MSDQAAPPAAPPGAPGPFTPGERVYVQCTGFRHETTFEKYDETSTLACHVKGHGRVLLSRVSRR